MNRQTLPVPSSVLLILTNKCNLRCPYCLVFNPVNYWRAAPDVALPVAEVPREMTIDQVIGRVIPQCEKAGVKVMALTGGEILLRRNIVSLFRALGRSSLRWCMDSNMAFCTDEVANAILDAECDTVFASLDGPEDVHNRLRSSRSAFRQFHAGCTTLMKALRARPDRPTKLALNCVVQPGNEHCLAEVVRCAHTLDASSVTFQLLSAYAYGARFDTPAALDSLHEAIALGAELGVLVESFPVEQPTQDHLDRWFAEVIDQRFFAGCGYIHSSMRIDPGGNVIPCVENKLGNILEQDLLEIWHGEGYRLFRSHIDQRPLDACARCCNMDSVA
jgi:MoaA/NifB/PqqE/SkfB family radical SAM enzyme